ncbi:MarR family winged helix-turn-helix transcriptional regulator [Mobilicoccus massiliensis]|nr:MarR family transcriptional regulator [Mobilicoccus massiliensis]
MHPTDLRTLVLLLESDRDGRAIGPAQLAQQLGLTTAAVTSVVDRLERLGLVRRQPSATDRRRVEVRLTDEARTSTLGGLGHLVATIARRVGTYPPRDQAAVVRFLADVLDITADADRGTAPER